MVDWWEAVVVKRKEESVGTGTHSAEDGKNDGCEGGEKWRFSPVDFARFFALGEKGKSSE